MLSLIAQEITTKYVLAILGTKAKSYDAKIFWNVSKPIREDFKVQMCANECGCFRGIIILCGTSKGPKGMRARYQLLSANEPGTLLYRYPESFSKEDVDELLSVVANQETTAAASKQSISTSN